MALLFVDRIMQTVSGWTSICIERDIDVVAHHGAIEPGILRNILRYKGKCVLPHCDVHD